MLEYNKYSFNIIMDRKVVFRSLPSFIFRNNLGFHLKKITCVFENHECSDCMLKAACVYSSVFETPVDKNNVVLKGRNNAPHPYMVCAGAPASEPSDRLILDIVLIGEAVRYFPYILLAMLNIGKSGIFKDRIRFEIDDIYCRGESIMDKSNYSCKNLSPSVWDYCDIDGAAAHSIQGTEKQGIRRETVRINFETQVRIQRNGKYLRIITYKDFLYASARRVILLESFFGNGNPDLGGKLGECFIESVAEEKEFEADLKWTDYQRYSARQKQSMLLGGLIGTALVAGSFSEAELSLLRAAELFGVGKNVSFGLGKIKAEVI